MFVNLPKPRNFPLVLGEICCFPFSAPFHPSLWRTTPPPNVSPHGSGRVTVGTFIKVAHEVNIWEQVVYLGGGSRGRVRSGESETEKEEMSVQTLP